MTKKVSLSCGKYLDIAHVADIKSRVNKAFEKSGEVFMISADKIERVDSAGIQLLLVTSRKCRKHKIDFKIVKYSAVFHSAIELLGLTEHLSI